MHDLLLDHWHRHLHDHLNHLLDDLLLLDDGGNVDDLLLGHRDRHLHNLLDVLLDRALLLDDLRDVDDLLHDLLDLLLDDLRDLLDLLDDLDLGHLLDDLLDLHLGDLDDLLRHLAHDQLLRALDRDLRGALLLGGRAGDVHGLAQLLRDRGGRGVGCHGGAALVPEALREDLLLPDAALDDLEVGGHGHRRPHVGGHGRGLAHLDHLPRLHDGGRGEVDGLRRGDDGGHHGRWGLHGPGGGRLHVDRLRRRDGGRGGVDGLRDRRGRHHHGLGGRRRDVHGLCHHRRGRSRAQGLDGGLHGVAGRGGDGLGQVLHASHGRRHGARRLHVGHPGSDPAHAGLHGLELLAGDHAITVGVNLVEGPHGSSGTRHGSLRGY
mmetsp:Transcript_29479/g.87480  ORF Transcript_29479/g.87480 Transcript_29479/m.87480 type:complete len:378 (-) Transcript_29479:49-1182(-)